MLYFFTIFEKKIAFFYLLTYKFTTLSDSKQKKLLSLKSESNQLLINIPILSVTVDITKYKIRNTITKYKFTVKYVNKQYKINTIAKFKPMFITYLSIAFIRSTEQTDVWCNK